MYIKHTPLSPLLPSKHKQGGISFNLWKGWEMMKSLYVCYYLTKTLIETTSKLANQIAVDERNQNMKK
jgi:hypothetical protein